MLENDVSPDELREPELERFCGEHLARFASVRGAGMAVVLRHLRGLGIVPALEQRTLSAAEELLEQYRRNLMVERGLTAGTTRGYVDIVRPFVEARVASAGEVELWDLSPADVLGFLLAEAECGRGSRRSCW